MKTKITTIIGITALVVCGLFPPWQFNQPSSYRGPGWALTAGSSRSAGHHFLLAPPAPDDGWNAVINGKVLLLEWLCVGGIYYAIHLLVNTGRDRRKSATEMGS